MQSRDLPSYPGSSQFFNDAHRKTTEPVIFITCMTLRMEGRWCCVGIRVHSWDSCWEKSNRKTIGSSKLESPGIDMLARAKTATNVKYTSDLFVCKARNGACTTPSP